MNTRIRTAALTTVTAAAVAVAKNARTGEVCTATVRY